MPALTDIIKLINLTNSSRFNSQFGGDSGGFFAGPQGLGGVGNAVPGQGLAELLKLFELFKSGGMAG